MISNKGRAPMIVDNSAPMIAADDSAKPIAPRLDEIAHVAPMISVDDRVRFTRIENGSLTNVVAFVTAVHDDRSIDISWRGDAGGIHPDNLGRSDLELHARERVPQVADEPCMRRDGELRVTTLWEPIG